MKNKRGEKEKGCFDKVSDIILGQLKGKSQEEYDRVKTQIPLTDKKYLYGLKIEDIYELRELFYKAKPNSKLSEFPDYESTVGFIEHFEVTSSNIIRKGYKQKIEETKFEKELSNNEDALHVFDEDESTRSLI